MSPLSLATTAAPPAHPTAAPGAACPRAWPAGRRHRASRPQTLPSHPAEPRRHHRDALQGPSAARLRRPPICHAPELMPPPSPTGGSTAAADRMRRRAVAAALAPWKQAIAAVRAAQPHAPVHAGPPRHAGAAKPHAPIRRPDEPDATTSANPRIDVFAYQPSAPEPAPALTPPPGSTRPRINPGRPTPSPDCPQMAPPAVAERPRRCWAAGQRDW